MSPTSSGGGLRPLSEDRLLWIWLSSLGNITQLSILDFSVVRSTRSTTIHYEQLCGSPGMTILSAIIPNSFSPLSSCDSCSGLELIPSR